MKSLLYLRTDLGTRDLSSGGSVAHTLGVLEGFIAQKTVIYCASSAMHSLLSRKKGVYFKRLVLPRFCAVFGFKLSCLFSNVWFLWQLLWFIRNTSIDAVYQRYSMLNIVGVCIAKIKGVPLVLEFNGSEAWVDMHWGPQKKKRWLSGLITRFEWWNVSRADYIIVVSDVLKNMLKARGVDERKILVNPNGVDVQLFNPEKNQHRAQEVRRSLAIEEKYVFGFIGSFSYWHGIEIIGAIIPKITKINPRAHFMLIGTGPLSDQLQAEIERAGVARHVSLIGSVAYKHAPTYLSACDAFLCPTQPNADGSPFFGSPTKLFEYMSMGKPIIASDVDQLRDIIDRQFGYLVQPDDVDGFVSVACDLMQHSEVQQKKMGVRARCAAVEKFSWDRHVAAIRQFVP